MATLSDLTRLIGSEVMVPDGDVEYRARITDAKEAYGNVRVKVEPLEGSGSTWRNLDNVRLLIGGGE